MRATFTRAILDERAKTRPAGYAEAVLAAAEKVGEDEYRLSDEAFAAIKAAFPPKSRGLGDTIAKVTSAIGIKPCGGCKKRQELLNKLIPYGEIKGSNG